MAGHRKRNGTVEVVWNGRRYRRIPDHPDRHRRVYFMATTAPRTYLHRDIYTASHGPIPDGWHVHHADHDPSNNDPSNLVALSPSRHAEHHGEHLEALERACDGCGQLYVAKREWSRWCSSACKERKRRADGTAYRRPRKGPMAEPRACDECGADFVARKPWARFCSGICRNRSGNRERRSAG